MKRFSLLISDIIILYASLAIMILFRYGSRFSEQFNIHLIPFLVIFGLWIITFYILNLYEIQTLKNGYSFYVDFIKAITISFSISVAFFYLFPLYGITPKTNLIVFSLIFLLLGFLNRFGLNALLENAFKKRLVIVGINHQSLELARHIKDNPQLGYRLAHVVDLTSVTEKIEEEFKEFSVVRGITKLQEIINSEKIDVIIISPDAYQVPKIIELFYGALEKKVNFYDLSLFYEQVTGMVPLGTINQTWFIGNLTEGSKNSYETIKRGTDIVISIVVGAVFLVIYPFAVLAIKLSSSGPIFYHQKRVGLHGKVFKMIKFRTMPIDAEKDGAIWASENDTRANNVGRFMRRTRIDELPQVWNILKDEMSFVGPRAERPEFHKQLQDGVPFYEERYLIKPGLTGWAQINYRYGASINDAAEKLKYDLYYIKNRSLPLDIGILLKTIRIALQQAGR
ncbi:MAG: hypothetical protein A2568_03595 [Candidatus Yanofskybacteria bacterium RIFOXYD1_FULL_44_17]|uniref:Sugar transferase n=1 Tax=Candidatus Yanofskybacteria bacterium GW2011_GWE2_40_11 TaxID=1619033 RepID=A0A0G0TSB8_9BACT|nr:MAG: Sugar transferase [Candidatus Yanofskybacteria bacterium GW2011_GWE1_40_10]KKR40752.1 MAG: Sugar transferase [Candidatus Yanofskybacteria bacterium GW2011_GWE2_40_11]OGN36034.1 MAG: hypothetical protein A2207_03175 [Candidatus Yanofskybacteria bacterium RIFOXYA1_FULL_44_17]OGN36364.1 MAG: hypothetical protein A2241_01310 [Candidatus Yanofskybacteria bacterium RIFOXYA2_FULL_45_28]OGN37457.1 MAG: hypothetical protein A2371_00625 [Candidatus Yanofskybacteria bacterium RIFOXYB1_FULL_44_29]